MDQLEGFFEGGSLRPHDLKVVVRHVTGQISRRNDKRDITKPEPILDFGP